MRIIGGRWGGRRLVSLKGENTRPTSDAHRESIFNVLQNGLGLEPRSVLDLFAGTGALGWESLSRGALSAVFVECDPGALKTLEANARELAVSRSDYAVIKTSRVQEWATALTATARTPFDLVFCDPPYAKDLVTRALNALEDSAGALFAPGAWLVAEIGSEDEEPRLAEAWELQKDRGRGVTRLLYYRRRE